MERKKAYRDRQIAKGLVQVSGWAPADQVGALLHQMKRLSEDRDLELGTLRSKKTGRLTK